MTETQTTPIKGQDSAYRRGMILGLTMAEIMLLILFMLLLTFGMLIADRERAVKELSAQIQGFSSVSKFLAAITKENPAISVPDIIQRIERQQKDMTKLQRENETLRSEMASASAINDIIKQIKRDKKGDAAAEVARQLQQLGALRSELENSKGQITQLTEQIKATGKGNEFPSCWVTPDGKPQSIFDFVLSASGVTVVNRAVGGRDEARAELPIQNVPIGREISFSEFSQSMMPLYQWSVQHGCRFYVMRYSTVGAAPVDGINQIDLKFYPDSRIIRVNN